MMSGEPLRLFRDIVSQAKKLSLEMGFGDLATKYEDYLKSLRVTSPDTVNLSLCIMNNGKTYVIPRTQVPSLLRAGGEEANALVDYWRRLG